VTPRGGTAWDVLAVVALVLPLAGLAVPLAGPADRRSTVAVARVGALAAAALWVLVLAAGAAPELGPFEPEPLALAAAAGAVLVAASLAEGPTAGALAAAPAAALVAVVAGTASAPGSLDTGPGVLLVAAAAALTAVALLLPEPALAVVVPGVLVGGLWGAGALTDPPISVGLVLAAVAVLPAHVPRLAPRDPARRAAMSVAIAALAVAIGPVEAARPAAPLLVAGAVLVLAAARRWALLATLPGAAVVAGALADVPTPEGLAPGVHVGAAVLLAAVAARVVAMTWDDGGRAQPVDARAAAGALVLWLVMAPGSWRWAVTDTDLLDAWDRAAATAAAAVATALVVGAAAAHPERWPRRARH